MANPITKASLLDQGSGDGAGIEVIGAGEHRNTHGHGIKGGGGATNGIGIEVQMNAAVIKQAFRPGNGIGYGLKLGWIYPSIKETLQKPTANGVVVEGMGAE